MACVDAFLLKKLGVGSRAKGEPHDFYSSLAHEIIHNTYDTQGPNCTNREPSDEGGSDLTQEASDTIQLPQKLPKEESRQACIETSLNATNVTQRRPRGLAPLALLDQRSLVSVIRGLVETVLHSTCVTIT